MGCIIQLIYNWGAHLIVISPFNEIRWNVIGIQQQNGNIVRNIIGYIMIYRYIYVILKTGNEAQRIVRSVLSVSVVSVGKC